MVTYTTEVKQKNAAAGPLPVGGAVPLLPGLRRAAGDLHVVLGVYENFLVLQWPQSGYSRPLFAVMANLFIFLVFLKNRFSSKADSMLFAKMLGSLERCYGFIHVALFTI